MRDLKPAGDIRIA